MGIFNIGLSAVFPLFVYLCIGILAKKINWLGGAALKQLNSLCFKIFLPVSMFYNIVKSDIREIFDGKLVLLALCAQVLMLIFGLLFGKIFTRNKLTWGAYAHCMLQINFIIYGTQIMSSLFGEGNLGSFALVSAIIVPIQNVVSVIMLEKFSGEETDSKALAKSVIKNPYVVAAMAALVVIILKIKFPTMVLNVFRDLGRCGSPMVVIGMGAMLNFESFGENLKSIISFTVIKLLICPAIIIPLAIKAGISGVNLAVIMCVAATPTAPAAFTVASQTKSDNDFHSQTILLSTLASLFTIFGWIVLLTNLQLL